MSIKTGLEYIGFIDPWTDEERLSDEEIVRCNDCRKFHLDNSDHDYRSGWWCDRWDTDMVEPDGFCAWGKAVDDASVD